LYIVDKLLHYSISEKLGEGKNGRTYLALDTGLQRPVVIKLLEHPECPGEDWKRGFLEKMKRLSGVRCDSIGSFYAMEQDDGNDFVVREHAAGKSVYSLSQEDPIKYRWFLQVARQAAAALEVAHASGQFHGNINSGNLIVDDSWNARLVDFCLNRTSVRSADSYGERDLAFAAPELLRGEPASAAADLYSLGVVLYHLFTGQLPFVAESTDLLRQAILTQPVPFGGERAGKFPSDARLLIGQLLSKEPVDRFTSAEELSSTLQGMQSYHTELHEDPHGKKAMFSARQYAWMAILALLLIVFWLVVTMDAG